MVFRPQLAAIVIVLNIFISTTATAVDDLQLLYPDNNVSAYKPIVEFRSRQNHHAFVALGRELDNGLVYFYAAGGFYPREGSTGFETFKNILYSNGSVTYKIKDLSDDNSFRVNVTREQEFHVRAILKAWDEKKDYAVWLQNCTDLVKDIAESLGLKTGDGIPFQAMTPDGTIDYLRLRNDANRPINFENEDRANRAAAREPIRISAERRIRYAQWRQEHFPDTTKAQAAEAQKIGTSNSGPVGTGQSGTNQGTTGTIQLQVPNPPP